MKRSVSISNKNKKAFDLDLEVSRLEYLPMVTLKIRDISVFDGIEQFMDLINIIESGENMRDVRIGDDNVSMSFVRQSEDSTVEVTIKKMDVTIVQKYDVDELAVALRFITAENSSPSGE